MAEQTANKEQDANIKSKYELSGFWAQPVAKHGSARFTGLIAHCRSRDIGIIPYRTFSTR